MRETSVFEQGLQILEAWDEVSVFHADKTFTHLEELIRQGDFRKIAVFTGRNSADSSGAWAKLLNSLRYTECAVVRFKDIPPEPDMQTVYAMKEFLAGNDPDGVIALGIAKLFLLSLRESEHKKTPSNNSYNYCV